MARLNAERLPTGCRPLGELRFVVVGAYVMDCFVNTAHLPAWGHEREARSIRVSPGGKALNQAVALARLGAQVSAVGVLGQDSLGHDIRALLTRERVDVTWVEMHAGAATTVCLCFVGDHGQSAIMCHIDDEVAVTADTVRAAEPAFERADIVLVTFEMPVATVGAAIRAGRRGGARVLVQPAPLLADPAGAGSLPWDQIDVLVPNEIEARALLNGGSGALTDDLAGALGVELGVPTVVVTLGEAGCTAHVGGMSRRYPAVTTVAVDTTGASDAFTATLAAWLAAGASEAQAVQAAQSAAARTVGSPGGHESMPSPG